MAKIGELPPTKFRRDGDRYIVFFGDDRIGFVRQDGKKWNAVDTFMEKSVDRPSREGAALWLVREFSRAIKEGRV